MSFIMTQNGTLDHASSSVITGGAFLITTPPSLFSKSEGVPIYDAQLFYTFVGGSAPGFVDGTVASTVPQTITPTSIGYDPPIVREGDTGVLNAVGSLIGGGTGPVVGTAVVSDAGQDEVFAE